MEAGVEEGSGDVMCINPTTHCEEGARAAGNNDPGGLQEQKGKGRDSTYGHKAPCSANTAIGDPCEISDLQINFHPP